MSTLVLETEPLAAAVAVTEEDLMVDLSDGRRIIVPLAWYPRLLNATLQERQNWQLLGEGYAIEWPDLDEHWCRGVVSRTAQRGEFAIT